MPIHKYHILHISQRCWHVLGEVWTSLQRVNVANWTRGWIRLLHICSGASVMFVHQQKVNHIFNFSESTALPIHLYIVGGGPEKVMDWIHSSRYLHEHTQTLLHLRPPMEKKRRKKPKSDVCVFQKGHMGETQHASILVSFSQGERYSGGRGQRLPAGQFTALLWEFYMIQVWEWRVGIAGAVNSLWQFYLDCQIKQYLVF